MSHNRRELFAIELNEGQAVQIGSCGTVSRHTHGATAFAITFKRVVTRSCERMWDFVPEEDFGECPRPSR